MDNTTNQHKVQMKHTPEELYQIYQECNVPGTPVKLEPYQVLKSTSIFFTSYPSTVVPREKLNRAVATSKNVYVVKQGETGVNVNLTKEEKWIFLHDVIYDLGVETTNGQKAVGGCALFYVPTETKKADVYVGNYHIDPNFIYDPETKEMHFVIT